jgi:hypothetical protein
MIYLILLVFIVFPLLTTTIIGLLASKAAGNE